MPAEFVNPSDAWDSIPRGYSHVVKVSNPRALYFVAGAAAVDNELHILHPGDVEGQTRLIFEYIRRDLEAAGSSLDDIVRMTVYLADREHQWLVRNIRKEFFDSSRLPASTMIEVKGFCIDGMLVEIDVIAAT